MPKLYHVSKVPNITVLTPKIPQNILTAHGLEDSVTHRISFAPTIAGCLRGIGHGLKGRILYVYTPISIDKKHLIKPKPEQVPDVRLTNEYWYLKPVNVKLAYVIKGGNVIDPKVFYIGGRDSALFSISKGLEYEIKQRYRNGKPVK